MCWVIGFSNIFVYWTIQFKNIFFYSPYIIVKFKQDTGLPLSQSVSFYVLTSAFCKCVTFFSFMTDIIRHIKLTQKSFQGEKWFFDFSMCNTCYTIYYSFVAIHNKKMHWFNMDHRNEMCNIKGKKNLYCIKESNQKSRLKKKIKKKN